MYCYYCGKFYKADEVNEAGCCDSPDVLLHFIPPMWVPKRLLVLTIELYDYV